MYKIYPPNFISFRHLPRFVAHTNKRNQAAYVWIKLSRIFLLCSFLRENNHCKILIPIMGKVDEMSQRRSLIAIWASPFSFAYIFIIFPLIPLPLSTIYLNIFPTSSCNYYESVSHVRFSTVPLITRNFGSEAGECKKRDCLSDTKERKGKASEDCRKARGREGGGDVCRESWNPWTPYNK